VRFLVELEPVMLEALRTELGVPLGVLDDGRVLDVRVPMLAVSRMVLARAGRPVVMIRLGATGAAEGLDPRESDLDDRIGCVLAGGPTLHAAGSTTVRLHANGGFAIERVGAVSEAEVMAAAERVILFVCTGNTCRSPMAAAIAGGMVERSNDDIVTVISAGIATADGMPAAPEAIETVRRMGLDLSSHRTRMFSRSLCASADVIYVMTAAHRARVLEVDPSAESKTFLLDPDGDVLDPIGLPLSAYEATARQMQGLITDRLKEFDA
jgi:protein-tyrosine phosphatase